MGARRKLGAYWAHNLWERCEGVQGVLTLVFREVAQAFHDDRVVELSGQLEEEEQDGRRTEDNHKHSNDHGYGDEMKWKTQDT